MKTVVLTCSTGRPESLQLCRIHIASQTVPVTHVVAEGGTLHQNLATAIEDAPEADLYLIAEDDDFYHSGYVELVQAQMAAAPDALLGGLGYTCCYHLVYRRLGKEFHPGRSSLHSTALRPEGLEHLYEIACEGNKRRHIDMQVWSLGLPGTTWDIHEMPDGRRPMVSLKGVVGTPGISSQHSPHRSIYTAGDSSGRILDRWIGKGIADAYRGITRRN